MKEEDKRRDIWPGPEALALVVAKGKKRSEVPRQA